MARHSRSRLEYYIARLALCKSFTPESQFSPVFRSFLSGRFLYWAVFVPFTLLPLPTSHLLVHLPPYISPSLGYKVPSAFLHALVPEIFHLISLYLSFFRCLTAYRGNRPGSPGGISTFQSIQQSRNSVWQTVESNTPRSFFPLATVFDYHHYFCAFNYRT